MIKVFRFHYLYFFFNAIAYVYFLIMKLEHLFKFFNYTLTWKFFFNFFFFLNTYSSLILNYFFNWKVLNFADGYWFIYSNKKSIFELRYIDK